MYIFLEAALFEQNLWKAVKSTDTFSAKKCIWLKNLEYSEYFFYCEKAFLSV